MSFLCVKECLFKDTSIINVNTEKFKKNKNYHLSPSIIFFISLQLPNMVSERNHSSWFLHRCCTTMFSSLWSLIFVSIATFSLCSWLFSSTLMLSTSFSTNNILQRLTVHRLNCPIGQLFYPLEFHNTNHPSTQFGFAPGTDLLLPLFLFYYFSSSPFPPISLNSSMSYPLFPSLLSHRWWQQLQTLLPLLQPYNLFCLRKTPFLYTI